MEVVMVVVVVDFVGGDGGCYGGGGDDQQDPNATTDIKVECIVLYVESEKGVNPVFMR